MPMVPVYKLKAVEDLDGMAENGGWPSHKEMCADIGVKPEEFIGTYQVGDDYEWEGEAEPTEPGPDWEVGLFISFRGFSDGHYDVHRNHYPIIMDENDNLFACMAENR